jgi:predicted permease
MSTLVQDVRYAVRMFRKTPLFTAIAVLTLALGIGLNTAVFSAVDALVLRQLPGVRDPDELVQLYRTWPGVETGSNSVPHFQDIRDNTGDIFAGVTLWDIVPVNLSSGSRTERITGEIVSASFFDVFGATAERGRTFVAAEDSSPGAHPVAVVSHAAWQGMFGGDEHIIGRAITLNGHAYTVIGVMPPEFRGPVAIIQPAVWVPLVQIAQIEPGYEYRLTSRGNNSMSIHARLRPGVSVAQAREHLQALVTRLRERLPDDYKDSGIALFTQAEAGMHPRFQKAQVGLSAVVMAVVLMLLLIACVNVANLFLARARDRSREMAIRLSIGAGRWQLVRQLLTESIVFAIVAGSAGLLVAWWVIALVNHIRLPIGIAIQPNLSLSVPVLLFTLGVSLATGIIFGLVPALQATRPALVPALKGESPAGASRSRASRGLVVAQMALSLVLLVCAGLFLRSLRAATTMDTGFAADNLLLASLDPGLQGYDRARTHAFYQRLLERLRANPQVRAVSLATTLPLGIGSSDAGIDVPGYVPAKGERMNIDYNIIVPDYFTAMGIRILRGRDFTAHDDSTAAGVVIVNQRFVDRFWPGQDPIGRTVTRGKRTLTVVGLVPTGKYHSLGEPATAFMYFPQEQQWVSAMALTVRTTGDPAALATVVRNEVAALDPELPVSDVRTARSHLGIALLPARLVGGALGVFGLLGLVLAAVGMYGVMSYSVAQRTREIGIRMAVGAARGQVVRLVIGQGLALVLIGTVIGLAGALAGTRLVRGFLYGASALDPVAFIAVPAVLLGVALLAIWVPARRAATVDPMVALRVD